jgi:hypothetical protein
MTMEIQHPAADTEPLAKMDDRKDPSRPMNGWEALVRIVNSIGVTAVFLALIGLVYTVVR